MTNGYTKPIQLNVHVPAEMLESWAGYSEAEVDKEFRFAVACLDTKHPATLKWLAAGIDRMLVDIGGE